MPSAPWPVSNAAGIDLSSPLEGVRVVEFSHYIAGPVAGLRLADLGADVVKVEPRRGEQARWSGGGDDNAAMFNTFNRNKRSVALDLFEPTDLDSATELTRTADVVIHNASETAMARRRLDAVAVRRRNSGVIYGKIRGYPAGSIAAERRGFDSLAQAESGMLSVTGEPGGGPLRITFSPVDIMAGELLAEGVLAALVRRLRSGRGSVVEVSLFEAALHLQAHLWGEYLQTGVEPGRVGNIQPLVAPGSEIFDTPDGAIMLSAYADAHWRALCSCLEMPGLIDDPRFRTNALRVENRDDLRDILRVPFASMTLEQASAMLRKAGIAFGVVCSYSQVLDGQLMKSADILRPVTRADGRTYLSLRAPLRFGDQEPVPTRRPPNLGEHEDEIIRESEAEE